MEVEEEEVKEMNRLVTLSSDLHRINYSQNRPSRIIVTFSYSIYYSLIWTWVDFLKDLQYMDFICANFVQFSQFSMLLSLTTNSRCVDLHIFYTSLTLSVRLQCRCQSITLERIKWLWSLRVFEPSQLLRPILFILRLSRHSSVNAKTN